MKHLTLFILLAASCLLEVNAQNIHKFKLNNNDANRISDFTSEMKKAAIHVNYSQIGFFNPTYFQNIEDEVLENKGGVNVTIERRVWLFRFDIGGFYNWYTAKDNNGNYQVRGLDAFVSFLPMPDWGKISKVVVPSIGLGYQTASLEQTETDSNDKTEAIASLGLGGPLWKAGLQINLGSSFFINGDYKQSLFLNKNKATNTLAIGVGIRW